MMTKSEQQWHPTIGMDLINIDAKQKKPDIKKYVKIGFNLYKVQKRQKQICDIRSQESSYLGRWGVMTGRT